MTGDGSDVTLTLSISPVNENNTQVFIDGVYQSKSNYSISGTTLTFSTAPPTGTAVEVMTFTQTDINVPVDGTVTSAKLSGDLTTPGALTVTGTTIANTSGGVVTLGTSGHVTSKQSLDVATAGGRFIGSSNRGILGQIRIEQTANSTDGGYIAFDTSPSGSTSPTEAMRISGGRVGIGGSTITDSNLLNIQGSSVSVNVGVVFNDTNTSKIFAIQNGGSALKFFDYTASAERMRIDSSGNVGIGTTSPSNNKLVISDSSDVGIQITKSGVVSGSVKAVSTGLAFGVDTSSGGTERMRITSAGKVGIGETSPAATLHLDSTGVTAIAFDSNAGTQQYEIGTGYAGVGSANNFYLYNNTSSSAAFVVDTSGKLGIGTSSPAQLIHGKTASGNAYMRIERASKSTGQVGLQIGGGTSSVDWFTYIPASSDDLAFFGNSAERMRINSSGNVTIGNGSLSADVSMTLQGDTGGYAFTHVRDAHALTLTDTDGSGEVLRVDTGGSLRINGSTGYFGEKLTVTSSTSYTQTSVRTGTGNEGHIVFRNGNGGVGTIFTNGSSTAYNTSSDYRLKENVVAMSGATERLKQLNPSRFNFIADADTLSLIHI